MIIAGIDPGPTYTGLVIASHTPGKMNIDTVVFKDKVYNVALEPLLSQCEFAVIEMIACYGMPVGKEVFETAKWIGRIEHALEIYKIRYRELYRLAVKMQMCRSPKANDGTIRQALIDRYGGKEQAIGLKAKPGTLYGVVADCWSALALIQTHIETERFS